MKLYAIFLLTALMLSGSAFLFSQPARPTVSREPVWISKHSTDYDRTSLDKDATDGYIDISYEIQVSLADQSRYFRRSKKIISQAGVQNGSEISVSFDPLYEKLSFHTIRIIRKGDTLNRLSLENIKIVHQEQELTNFIYNGSLNALLIVEDVRRGDIIEYSYTIKGFNPIFKNKYAEEYSMEFSVPLYEIYYKLIVPRGRKINIKNLGEVPDAAVTTVNGGQVYEWHKNNALAVHLQDFTPSWHDPYTKVLVSEYNNWKEVNDWAMELFPEKKRLSEAILKKVKEIEETETADGERTKAALKFIQDDIRYMGIEMGENSHKPADPSKVFAQRFGDCKEKSYLLCCMLRAMNINASPVLINTNIKRNLNTLLPAPTDFDHVTVRVKLDDVYYWYDPTIAYQRGDIKNLFYPDYQAGLVISDSSVSLTNIIFRDVSYVDVKERFKVYTMWGGGILTAVTTYTGKEADGIRDDFNNKSIPEIMTSYQKFYATYYENIKADSLTFVDDDSTGAFTTKEYYSIPKFWTLDKDKGNKFSFSPFIINNVFRRPKERNRTMPFSLLFPARYKEEVIIDLPHDWDVTQNETHLKNASYAYNSNFYCEFNQVHLKTTYENYKDCATVDEAPAYFKDLREYDEVASFELSSGAKDQTGSYPATPANNIISAILFIGVIAGGIFWWSRRK